MIMMLDGWKGDQREYFLDSVKKKEGNGIAFVSQKERETGS